MTDCTPFGKCSTLSHWRMHNSAVQVDDMSFKCGPACCLCRAAQGLQRLGGLLQHVQLGAAGTRTGTLCFLSARALACHAITAFALHSPSARTQHCSHHSAIQHADMQTCCLHAQLGSQAHSGCSRPCLDPKSGSCVAVSECYADLQSCIAVSMRRSGPKRTPWMQQTLPGAQMAAALQCRTVC